KFLQNRGDGNVKNALRAAMQIERRFQDCKSPRVHLHTASGRLAIEDGDVARRVVKAHQPVNARYGLERRFYRGLGGIVTGIDDTNLDEGPEQRPRAANVI